MSAAQPTVRVFRTPREVVWGRGSISHLENIKGKRALIVTDKTMTKLGTVATTEHYLKKAGLEVKVFDGVNNFMNAKKIIVVRAKVHIAFGMMTNPRQQPRTEFTDKDRRYDFADLKPHQHKNRR